MTINVVDPYLVWSKFLENLKDQNEKLPVNYLMFLKGYVLELPEILKKVLNRDVALISLCHAKALFYRFALASGYPDLAVDAMYTELSIAESRTFEKEKCLNYDLDDAARQKIREFQYLIVQLKMITKNPPVFFGDDPEWQVMQDYFGMNAEALSAVYYGADFRIKNLLLVDPRVIIRTPVKSLPKIFLAEEK